MPAIGLQQSQSLPLQVLVQASSGRIDYRLKSPGVNVCITDSYKISMDHSFIQIVY